PGADNGSRDRGHQSPTHDDASAINHQPSTINEFPATRLFVERAQAARPGWQVSTAAEAEAVIEICRRLDGIALAIELAAARVEALSPVEILQRLEDRFSLLTRGVRTAPPRHRTLRALIDWS